MNLAVEHLVSEKREALFSLCRITEVRELGLFGSGVSDSFDPERSDLNFIVEFNRSEAPGVADRYMNLATGLEEIFHRKVDLLTRGAMKNPIFRKSVDRSKQIIYAG